MKRRKQMSPAFCVEYTERCAVTFKSRAAAARFAKRFGRDFKLRTRVVRIKRKGRK